MFLLNSICNHIPTIIIIGDKFVLKWKLKTENRKKRLSIKPFEH